MCIHITHIETPRNADSRESPMPAYALTELTAARLPSAETTRRTFRAQPLGSKALSAKYAVMVAH